LDVKPGTPLLCIRQVDFDQHGRAVVYSVEYHVADWVLFSVERLGPGIATTDM
jgi:DNA-binding GntR family transcriptional regulator